MMKFQTAFINWHKQAAVFSLDFHPSGRLATGGADREVKVWTVTKEPFKVDFLALLKGHGGPVHTVRFSPDGLYLASCCDGGYLKLWRIDPNWKRGDPVLDEDHEFDQERWVNFKQFKHGPVCSQPTGSPLCIARGCAQGIYDLAWSPDGQYIVTGSLDNSVQVWDVHGSKMKVQEWQDHQHFVQGVAWDPWDSFLVSMSSDRSMRVYPRKAKNQYKYSYDKSICVRTKLIPFTPEEAEAHRLKKIKEAEERRRKKELKKLGSKDAFAAREPAAEVVLFDEDAKEEKEKEPKMKEARLEELLPLRPVAPPPLLSLPTPSAAASDAMDLDEPQPPPLPLPAPSRAASELAATLGGEKDKDKEGHYVRMFADEHLVTFFRRVAFSTDGRFLFAPTGLNITGAAPGIPPLSNGIRWQIQRRRRSRKRRRDYPPFIPLPYRMVYAVATFDAVVLYDTEHGWPIAMIKDAHYENHTDLAWTKDGRCLAMSSSDGYCSFTFFEEGELGTPLPDPEFREAMKWCLEKAEAAVRKDDDEKEEEGGEEEGEEEEAKGLKRPREEEEHARKEVEEEDEEKKRVEGGAPVPATEPQAAKEEAAASPSKKQRLEGPSPPRAAPSPSAPAALPARVSLLPADGSSGSQEKRRINPTPLGPPSGLAPLSTVPLPFLPTPPQPQLPVPAAPAPRRIVPTLISAPSAPAAPGGPLPLPTLSPSKLAPPPLQPPTSPQAPAAAAKRRVTPVPIAPPAAPTATQAPLPLPPAPSSGSAPLPEPEKPRSASPPPAAAAAVARGTPTKAPPATSGTSPAKEASPGKNPLQRTPSKAKGGSPSKAASKPITAFFKKKDAPQ